MRHTWLFLTLLAIPALLSAQDSLIVPRAKGSAKAPVTVYEMSDFQCPYCREFAVGTFPTIQKEYITTGKVRWVFLNNPLPMHPNAPAAAAFAMCASRQGKFWPTHDMLYAKQESWAPLKDPTPFLTGQMASLGLKSATMFTCLSSGEGRKLVQIDLATAQRAHADGTPNFLVEGAMISGLYPIGVWRKVLDSVVKVKQAKKP